MNVDPAVAVPPCPHPRHCPVALDRIKELAATAEPFELVPVPVTTWYRVYSAHDSFETPNPGVGNSRFAPFKNPTSDRPVPTMYLAETLAAALLETVFHNVGPSPGANVVAHRDLHGRLHARLLPPRELLLVDLRDRELARLGIARSQLTTSSAEHHPCTRKVARILYGHRASVDGIVWHSRQAEQQGFGQVEIMVVFCDRVGAARKTWRLARTPDALGALLEGRGLAAVNRIAVELGLTLTGDEF